MAAAVTVLDVKVDPARRSELRETLARAKLALAASAARKMLGVAASAKLDR